MPTLVSTRGNNVMPPPDVLLHTIGQSLLDTLDVSVLSDVVIEATAEFAGSIWKSWDARADYEQKCNELESLVRTDDDELEDLVDGVVQQLGVAARGVQAESVFGYLRLVPGAMRRYFRRPANPIGNVLPVGLPLYGSWDLLPLLPERMPQYHVGDRPWGIGDWELRELIELHGYGEVWKAVNPRMRDRPPVALHFFTSGTARRYLRDKAAPVLDRILLHGRIPGVVPLQAIHLFADPPCVQVPYLRAADLFALVQEARETGHPVDPFAATDVILQIAETLGKLHALSPAIAHGNLRGTNILLMTDGAGRRRCLLANLGLGGWNYDAVPASGEAGAVANPCRSPEQLPDRAPCAADDVYALGVLWYQLLEGDLSRVRPGGSSWRRRLAARGMATGLIELVEACFDDDPSTRPADGGVLAAAIRAVMANP